LCDIPSERVLHGVCRGEMFLHRVPSSMS